MWKRNRNRDRQKDRETDRERTEQGPGWAALLWNFQIYRGFFLFYSNSIVPSILVEGVSFS